MNYIKKLESEISALKENQKKTSESIQEFKTHLNSSKFQNDTTIQVRDVFNWLEKISENIY